MALRACLHYSRITYISEQARLHCISIYFSAFTLFTWHREDFFFPAQVIPSLFQNEIAVRSGMTFHSGIMQCKLKSNFFPRWNLISWKCILMPYPPLFTATEVNCCLSIYQTSDIDGLKIIAFLDERFKNHFQRKIHHAHDREKRGKNHMTTPGDRQKIRKRSVLSVEGILCVGTYADFKMKFVVLFVCFWRTKRRIFYICHNS